VAALPTAQNSSPASTVTLDTVTDLAQLEALRPDYERLGRVTGNLLPFALHDWHVTWCRHFLNCDPRVREQLLVYVVRDGQGACVALLPFILSCRRVGPLKVSNLNLLGADPAITELRAPLVEPGYEHLTARAVHDALEEAPHWDWIHWAEVAPPFASAVSGCGDAIHWQAPVSDWVIDLPPSWEAFRARLKRNIRESLRHGYNSLRRDGIAFEFEVIEQPEEVRQGLDRFLELHKMRADHACSAPHANRFASRISRDFLYAVCERLAARGIVRLCALKIRGHYVAMRLAFAVRDSLYLYYSGFDPAWWRYGVMTTTVGEAIKYAIANGLQTVHLSPTLDISKSRWGPRPIEYASAYQPRPSLRSRLANSAYRKARSEEHYPKILQRLMARHSWD
jgi:CelD/BcsL family acetyltransferase involved in cellulose biosynthesis